MGTPLISTNSIITLGKQLTLHCHVLTNRPIKYTWEKDGVSLTSNEANSSFLTIDSVTIKDYGYYTCQVKMFERVEKHAYYVLRVQCEFYIKGFLIEDLCFENANLYQL